MGLCKQKISLVILILTRQRKLPPSKFESCLNAIEVPANTLADGECGIPPYGFCTDKILQSRSFRTIQTVPSRSEPSDGPAQLT